MGLKMWLRRALVMRCSLEYLAQSRICFGTGSDLHFLHPFFSHVMFAMRHALHRISEQLSCCPDLVERRAFP